MDEDSRLTLRICLWIIGAVAALVGVIYLLWILLRAIL
jgi:hypothetical protein